MSKQTVTSIAEAVEVSVEHLSNLKKSLSIVVPVSQIEKEEAEEFKKLAPSAQVKGYRKGKVPLPLLKKFYAESVHENVARKLIHENLSAALKQHNFQPVGEMQIESLETENGQPIKIKASFEIYPQIEIMDITQLALKKFSIEITDADIDQKLEDLRVRHATWLPTKEGAQIGNQVKIDYEGKLDGNPVPDASNQNMTLKLGDEVMIADFEKQLIGVKSGDELTFDVQFPEDYGMTELAGKKINFFVKVHEVSVIQLPELDDNFAKKLDISEGLEKLKSKLRAFMEEEKQQIIQDHLKHQIMSQLTEKHPVEIPKAMLEAEIKSMQGRAQQQLAGILKEGFSQELSPELFIEEAGKRVTIGLIFSELVKQFNLKPDPESLQKKIEEMSSTHQIDIETLKKWLSSNASAHEQLTFAILEDQLIQKILAEAQIEEISTSYYDATQWKSKK